MATGVRKPPQSQQQFKFKTRDELNQIAKKRLDYLNDGIDHNIFITDKHGVNRKLGHSTLYHGVVDGDGKYSCLKRRNKDSELKLHLAVDEPNKNKQLLFDEAVNCCIRLNSTSKKLVGPETRKEFEGLSVPMFDALLNKETWNLVKKEAESKSSWKRSLAFP